MIHSTFFARCAAALAAAAVLQVQAQNASGAAGAVDMGSAVLSAETVAQGLFPEDECEQLKSAGFKCMGFRPAVRYSLPASSFRVGSADLPDMLKRQLEVFAEVLKTKRGNGKVVRIEGHADASGVAAANLSLSQRRAEAVKEYLVEMGADAQLLTPVGVGSNAPKNSKDPFAPENRRVEIGRASPPS